MVLTKGKAAVAGATGAGGIAAITTTVVLTIDNESPEQKERRVSIEKADQEIRTAKEKEADQEAKWDEEENKKEDRQVEFKANTEEGASENGIKNLDSNKQITLKSERPQSYWDRNSPDIWTIMAKARWEKLVKLNRAANNWNHQPGTYLKNTCDKYKYKEEIDAGLCNKELTDEEKLTFLKWEEVKSRQEKVVDLLAKIKKTESQ